jgi:phosphatidylglycerophosphate synthase
MGSFMAAGGYIASRWSLQALWLASVGLLLNWAGDSLDGTVARRRRIERPRYGFFVDHTSDLFSQALLFAALGLSPCAHLHIALLGLIAFLMFFVYTLICSEVLRIMRITYFGFGPTEIRALLIAGNLITLSVGVLELGRLLPGLPPVIAAATIHEGVIVLLVAAAIPALVVLAIREARVLAREDPALAQAERETSNEDVAGGYRQLQTVRGE